MKKFLLSILIALGCVHLCFAYQGGEGLWVGASETEVNPRPGAFIAGHTLNRKFTGLHDSLFAKAVVISDLRNTVAILTV
jgi:hypothetical protein